MIRDKVFEQLSKEIVRYIQDNVHSTQKCIDFVKYELYLRCVSKYKLKDLVIPLLEARVKDLKILAEEVDKG